MYYESSHDANLYLRHSVVKFNGDLVKVERVREDMQVEVYRYIDGDHVVIGLSDLDLEPVELGYVIDRRLNELIYLERVPSRNFRQGLSHNNVRRKGTFDWELPVNDRHFMKELSGQVYYSISQALGLLKSIDNELPLHPNYSLDSKGLVRYKTDVIGYVEGGVAMCIPPMAYMQEDLDECVNSRED